LIRVSHLILIQIIFIFSALALVLFYPQQEYSEDKVIAELSRQVNTTADQVFSLLDTNATTGIVSPELTANIQTMADNNEYIADISLLYRDSLNKSNLLHFGVSERERVFPDTSVTTFDALLTLLNTSPQRTLSSLSRDGNHVIFAVRPHVEARDYALIVAAHNNAGKFSKSGQAYLLFVLFLISALISLLIINLIFKGVKRPLGKLLQGFEKTASGQEFQMEEKGDKYIKGLIKGFNEMSRKLAENRKELASTNERLVKANRSLIESESILTALVDYSPDAIIVTDLEDQVIIYNQAAARDFEYTQSNLLGKKITTLIPVVNNDKTQSAQNDAPETQEVICCRSDSVRFPAVLVRTPLGPDGGRPMAMLYFIRSISESANYQEMILKLDRIASRGRMARDIAHEINNYLAILQGNVELIPMFLAKNNIEKVESKLSVMKETVAKISTFTDGLTRFSDENSEFAKEDLNQLVENLIAFLKPQNKFDNIFICTNLSENLPLVEIDTSQIQHLLVHLITNSAEAMASMDDSRWIVISTTVDSEGPMAIIKVADAGPGVRSDNIDKLFIKRFSTKRECTGLGLITCKNIVDNHLGELSYHSGEDSKAIFEMKIPISRENSPADENEATIGRKMPVAD